MFHFFSIIHSYSRNSFFVVILIYLMQYNLKNFKKNSKTDHLLNNANFSGEYLTKPRKRKQIKKQKKLAAPKLIRKKTSKKIDFFFASINVRSIFLLLYFIIFMEQSREKMEIQDEGQISKDQQDNQSQKGSKRRRLNKKIKKVRHRKKGNISKYQNLSLSIIEELIKKNDIFFSKNRQEIQKELKADFGKKIHVRDIIYHNTKNCFQVKREMLQKEVKQYRELCLMGEDYTAVQKVGLKSLMKGYRVCLNFLRDLRNTHQRNRMNCRKLLSQNQLTLIEKRQQLASQIVGFVSSFSEEKGYPQPNFDEVLLDILTLCKLNADTQTLIVNQIDEFTQREDYLLNCQEKVSIVKTQMLKNDLVRGIMIKNLRHSFDEEPIDFLNYHKNIEYYEDNGMAQTQFRKITDLKQFKRYAQGKKPRSKKHISFLLRTACTACFSEVSEFSNPILNCQQCHYRIHKSCQNFTGRCHRCRYSRTSNREKNKSKYCYVCERNAEKSTMIETVTNKYPHKYAHIYCMLLHHFWSVKNQTFIGQYVIPTINHNYCILCQKYGGHMFKCSRCRRSFHGMCAYMEGYSFRMNRGRNFEYEVQIQCCNSPPEKIRRLSFERKFKINFEKLIFKTKKEDQGLSQFIQETIRNNNPQN